IVSDEGGGELWNVDFPSGKASLLKRIQVPRYGDLFFSNDEGLVLLRESRGSYSVWDRDGISLGNLGVLGNAIGYLNYRASCRQILLWTENGDRLDFRRGFKIPIYGFLPERECSANKNWFQQFLNLLLN